MRTGGAGFGPSRSAPVSFVCRSELDLALTLDILNRELGVKRLLLERGGGANGAFLRAGLVDELNSSVRPWTARRVRRASSIRRRRTLTSGPPSRQ
jgi:riboflavin biosynthesis pyrimidine reductase